MTQAVSKVWPGLSGPPPADALVDLAERLTGALAEHEVIRLLAEEVDRRVRPRCWCLLLGDRDELRIEHVGGAEAPASLLRRAVLPGGELVWRALDTLETVVEREPAPEALIARPSGPGDPPQDAVALPFGGYEVMGCLEMVDVLGREPSPEAWVALRQAVRLAGVGIRNARRHRALTGDDGIDEITGLEGKSRFRTALQKELDRARRTGRTTSVLLVDLDHFKTVNTVHGRLVGSSLLAEVGTTLQLAIRRVDLATRWCGDTFALMLPETDRVGAQVVAGRIQERVRSVAFQIGRAHV